MPVQQTVAKRISFTGQALHSGRTVEMTLAPAPPGSGIVFRRTDLPGAPSVKADNAAVVDTTKCVAIGAEGWRIATIEHFMAAAHGLGLDNLLVEVNGAELPMGDNSANVFIGLLRQAGLQRQDSPQKIRLVTQPLWVSENDSYMVALPPLEPGLKVNYTFSADQRAIGAQHLQFHLGVDDFEKEIAPARTIAFLEEIENLRRQGLAMSDNMEAAVIVGPQGYVNQPRFPDEIVRHKILDFLGDLFLFGRIHACVIAVRSGHKLNHRLGQALMRANCPFLDDSEAG